MKKQKSEHVTIVDTVEHREICPQCKIHMHKQQSRIWFGYIPTSWLCRKCGYQKLDNSGFSAIQNENIIIKNSSSRKIKCPECETFLFNQVSRKKIKRKDKWIITSGLCRKCGHMELYKDGFDAVKMN